MKEPLIYLSTSEDSVLVLHYIDNTLTESFSDEISRNGFHHTNLLPDLILATDKQYGVIGLWKPPLQRTLTSLHTVFEAELASSISRIRRGTCRPPWVPPGRCIPGVVDGAKNILAAGVDGSFFQLMVLDAGALKLLGRLSGVRGTAGYVDGDLLGGVVERGAGWLRAKFGGEEEEFTALAREVLGLEDGHDVFEEVLSWVDALLNDAVL